MKKLTLAIVTLAAAMIGSSDVFAQGKWGSDSAECIKYLSYYKEYYKQKAYDEATPNWRKAYELCPATASQNMLIEGATLVRKLIVKNQNDPAYRDALVDTLLTLHDTRAQYYPKYAVTALNNKGIDIANYVKNDYQKQFDGFEGIIANNKENTRPNLLLFDLQAAINLYQQGSIDAETVIMAYQRNNDLLESMPSENEAEKEQIENIKTDMGSLFAGSKVASCDNLIELFTPRFEANPDDLQLATNIVKMLSSTEGCTDNDLFKNAANTMHRLDPSYNSAHFLYQLYSAEGDVDNAFKFIDEAIAYPESDNATDAQYAYEAATFAFKSSRNAAAFSYAMKAAELDETVAGKAYMLIGTIWGSLVCQGNEIERRAPYWVAVDYMVKAKNADPSLAEEANKHIAQYRQYYPQTAEAFMYNVTDGDSYTVSCGGMRAVTTVKTQQ